MINIVINKCILYILLIVCTLARTNVIPIHCICPYELGSHMNSTVTKIPWPGKGASNYILFYFVLFVYIGLYDFFSSSSNCMKKCPPLSISFSFSFDLICQDFTSCYFYFLVVFFKDPMLSSITFLKLVSILILPYMSSHLCPLLLLLFLL